MKPETRQNFAKPFMCVVVTFGVISALYSITHLPVKNLGFGYLLLAAITLGLGSRIVVEIPRCKGKISVSDTFILLSLLLYGVESSVLLAGADALASSLRISKKKLNIAFNTSVFLCSTFLTGFVLRSSFGSMPAFTANEFTVSFLLALSMMGLVQYAANSGLVATAVALRAGVPIWKMWHENFLWTSLTYFAGAFAAGIIAKMSTAIGLFAFVATAPIIAIVYFTYCTYLKNVEAAAKQTEVAQTHVEELNQHIAEQERISNALRESEEHFRSAFDHAVGMALVSPEGHWLEVNESLSSLLGYTQQELREKSFKTILHSEDLGETLTKMHELMEGILTTFQLENRYIHKQGHTIWVLSSASLVKSEDGTARHLVFQVQNISDRKKAEEHIHHAAFHDALTGLPNRMLFADRLNMAVEHGKRWKDYQFAVIFVDLDRFKIVNDSLGHDMGDKLLVELSQRLSGELRAVDTVARLGGDEFAILLDGITNASDATDIADRVQSSLQKPFDLDGHEFFTSASMGIAYSSQNYERPEDILRDADTAMYKAKFNGKARHEVFSSQMHTRAVEALTLENELRRALDRGEVEPYYQPILELATGKIVGFEALARWIHPERGLVSPADFIPLAEETGLIIPVGYTILKQACAQTAKWQNELNLPELTVSVNLSGKQFKQANLIGDIKEILFDTRLHPHHLKMEITETIVMEDTATAVEMLKQLKGMGIQISIDDFGTGYSSLSYLHRFPFDIIKIDRSFVSGMTIDKESLGIVKTITALASQLGKSVIAEGIEKEEDQRMLTEMGCRYGQGYLFSKPVNATSAAELLKTDLIENEIDINLITEQDLGIKISQSTYEM